VKRLDDPSSYGKILAFLEDPQAENGLTDHEIVLAKRYQDAYVMYRDCKSRSETVAKLMKVHMISRAQAYRAVSTAISLFGDAAKLSVDGARHLVTEIILEGINLARKLQKPGIMILGAERLGKAWNVENPTEEAMAAIQPHTYILNLDPQSLLILSKMANTGSIDFTKFLENLPIQDADYTEIKDQPSGQEPSESNAEPFSNS
jgi:hypothetical protein